MNSSQTPYCQQVREEMVQNGARLGHVTVLKDINKWTLEHNCMSYTEGRPGHWCLKIESCLIIS